MEIPPRYDEALNQLPNNDWMLLSELNNIILKYSVGGWKKEDFLKRLEKMDEEKKGTSRKKLHTMGSLKTSLKEVGIKYGLSKYNRKELIRVYLKDKIYKENKDKLCILDREELIHFLDEYKDRLKEIIKTIPEGNQALLKVDDIVDVNHGFHHKEASRELIHLSNPLYTLFTMITEHYHIIHPAHREQVDTLTADDEMGRVDEMRNKWSEHVPNELDDMIRITYKTYNSIKETSLEIMKIILVKLYDVDTLNHRANINPIVNIILHGNYVGKSLNYTLDQMERFDYSQKLFQLLVNNGLERVNIAGVRYDIILGERGNVFYHSVNGKTLLSEMPFLNHLPYPQTDAVLTSLQEGGDATYYSICRSHLKDIWKGSRRLHQSQKRLNLALGAVDPTSPLSFIEEAKLIESMGGIKPPKRLISESLRRQHLIGNVEKGEYLAEKRLKLGQAISTNKSMIVDIPMDIIEKVLFYLSNEHYPIPEKKMSSILKEIKDKRSISKGLGIDEPIAQSVGGPVGGPVDSPGGMDDPPLGINDKSIMKKKGGRGRCFTSKKKKKKKKKKK